MRTLITESISPKLLKLMPQLCANLLRTRKVDYLESLSVSTQDIADMPLETFSIAVIDPVVKNPKSHSELIDVFQEIFCNYYSDLSEALLFELDQTASDIVENLQDYFNDFNLHHAELRIIRNYIKATRKYAFLMFIRSSDYNFLVSIDQAEFLKSQFETLPDDLEIEALLKFLEQIIPKAEAFIMGNPFCPNFFAKSGIYQKIQAILDFNYEHVFEQMPEYFVYQSYGQQNFQPFVVKADCLEKIQANADNWDLYQAYLLDCLAIELFVAEDAIAWAAANAKQLFYSGEYHLSYKAFLKAHSFILQELNLLSSELNSSKMFNLRIQTLAQIHKQSFEEIDTHLQTLRRFQIASIQKSFGESSELTQIYNLLHQVLQQFRFLTTNTEVISFLNFQTTQVIQKSLDLDSKQQGIIADIKNGRWSFSQEFFDEMDQKSYNDSNCRLVDLLI
ncbi:hypothetical protein HOH51_03400 [bacterium]|nr:hypothetical protein [bacterium]